MLIKIRHGIPEVAAVWVVAFLCQHASQEVDYKEHPVALMASSYVLTVVASWSWTKSNRLTSTCIHVQILCAGDIVTSCSLCLRTGSVSVEHHLIQMKMKVVFRMLLCCLLNQHRFPG